MKILFWGKFLRLIIKHLTIVINNTIQMNGGQYIEHMNNYQGKEDEKCLDKEKDNKKFKMWKFRSMRVARGANEASLRPDQDRIFWWGKIMRRLKIDELPQLMNILNGTMSIVGPRPAAVDQVDITRGGENAIAATVPCGLTSQSSLWDYIYGDQFPDEKEYNEKVLPIRLKLDVYYVKNASFFGDIKLIVWTVIAILYTACGKYPQWMHDKLVGYAKTV